MKTLVVTGANLVWSGGRPRGGHITYGLQWLLGLERLGYRVLYLDFLAAAAGDRDTISSAQQVFSESVAEWWPPESVGLLLEPSMQCIYGLPIDRLLRVIRESAALIILSVPGRPLPDLISDIRPRVLIEQDPGYSHLWGNNADPAVIFGSPDVAFTVGANIGTPRCLLPTHGIHWRPLWNPVVMSLWDGDHPIVRNRFTTVATWWGGEYVEFGGQMLGPKAEEFRKFADLPKYTSETLEIALEIEPDDPDLPYMRKHGWNIADPAIVAGPKSYREYVVSSLAEFSCTKGVYTGTQCGWFSDRSECYLAAARPVVLQNTGFADVLPTGKGLFTFESVEEAAEAIRAIRSDYALHSKAAREIAKEYFDSEIVLSRLLSEVGV